MTDQHLFAFANDAHDRRSDLRRDEGSLDRLWHEESTRVLVVGDGQVATAGERLRWLSPEQVPAGDRLYLGESGGAERFAVLVEEVPEHLDPQGIRSVGSQLEVTEAGLAAHAVGVANWHHRHPRCSRCGEATVPDQGGHVRTCPSCGAQHFPRTDPAVIMLATDEQDRALLGRQPVWPAGRYSTLAGFVEPGESLEDAVRREVYEEAGVAIGGVQYGGSQPWPFPSSLMLGFFARATSPAIRVDGNEIEDARWFTRDEVTRMTARGDLALPGRLSISRWLIEQWHGGTIRGAWR